MTALAPSTEIGHYRLNYELGGSSFSNIWLADHLELHLPAAIKIIDKSQIPPGGPETRFIREINLLNQMDHPFLIKTFEMFDDDLRHYLVLEFADHGSLFDHVQANGPIPEGQARRYFVQLISALDYLHNVSFVPHRNLKPENVLLDRFNNIRLIDFGLTGNVKGTTELSAASAPEVAAGKKYIYSSDVWSAGVILYYMLTAQFPFHGENREGLVHSIMEDPPVFEGNFSPPLIDLLRKLLQKQREERITIPRIMEHPWFSLALFKSIRTLCVPDTLDMEIVRKLAKTGMDSKLLPDIIARDRTSEQGILYEILRRDSLIESLNVAITGPGEGAAPLGRRFTLEEVHAGPMAASRPHLRTVPRAPPPLPHPTAAVGHAVHAVASVALSFARPGMRGPVNPRPGTTRPRPVRGTASSVHLT
jgi:serine/threonine protein kinase